MKEVKLIFKCVVFCIILFGLKVSAQENQTQYHVPTISGTGITKDFQGLSSIQIPGKGITIQTDDTTSYLFLKWHDVKAKMLGNTPRFRLCLVSGQRTFQYLEVLSADDKLIGTMDLSISASFQIIEFQIPIAKLKTVLNDGIKIICRGKGSPATFFMPSPEIPPSFYPHLLSVENKSSPKEAFLNQMASRSSLTNFGWQEGCVLDGLAALSNNIIANNTYQKALDDHLKLIFEQGKAPEMDGSIEATLCIAQLALKNPKHPEIEKALAFWQKKEDSEGGIIDGTQTAAEGNYTVGWPLAVLAKQLNRPDLAEKSILQLRLRRDRLVDKDGAIWLRHYKNGNPQRTYKLWSRGIAWYFLGLAKSLDILPNPPADLIAELQRTAQYLIPLQTEEGLWRVFADDPQTAPETSGTAGIGAAMAIGLRRGWLGKNTESSAQKALNALYGRLTPDGFLTAVAHSNMKEGGEPFQRKTKGTILQFGMGMMAQLVAELDGKELANSRTNQLKATKNLVALWDFKEPKGQTRKSIGQSEFALEEQNGTLQRISEGPLSGYSTQFGNKAFLSLPHSEVGKLNIYGKNQGVTVVAWVKWTGEQTGFVGGMWNEYQDGGKRQYGLFVSLPHYNGKNQVCGHISQTGKPTPPFPYSIDYSASKQEVPANRWVCVAFTYDGKDIKSYMNGIFEKREPELINNTKGFQGFPDGLVQSKNPYHFPYGMGNIGSDFTVGAVLLKNGMGNFFKGQIGGLAVFDRALSEEEVFRLADK
jgi:unsaturated rhamnogalacturonyl hydrolase